VRTLFASNPRGSGAASRVRRYHAMQQARQRGREYASCPTGIVPTMMVMIDNLRGAEIPDDAGR